MAVWTYRGVEGDKSHRPPPPSTTTTTTTTLMLLLLLHLARKQRGVHQRYGDFTSRKLQQCGPLKERCRLLGLLLEVLPIRHTHTHRPHNFLFHARTIFILPPEVSHLDQFSPQLKNEFCEALFAWIADLAHHVPWEVILCHGYTHVILKWYNHIMKIW